MEEDKSSIVSEFCILIDVVWLLIDARYWLSVCYKFRKVLNDLPLPCLLSSKISDEIVGFISFEFQGLVERTMT